MSLNGLDVQPVKDAYNTATIEAAGWFLLKYVSRDVVELLGSGISGVSEAKTAVVQYEEKSPLYGLIVFRRKKVLIKYIPEGTSRLLQARTAVHFQDIVEKFSPYEALLEISTADALNDTSLANLTPLHAGTGQGSNTKLDEITEDAEESTSPPRLRKPQHAPSISSMSSRKAALERSAAYKRAATSNSSTLRPPILQVTSDDGSTRSPLESPNLESDDMDDGAGGEEDEEDHNQLKDLFPLPPSSPRRPPSRDTANGAEYTLPADFATRPSTESFEGYQTFDYRPKIKLGPRPVTLTEKRRGSQIASVGGRPTSNLPAGVQMRAKQSQTTLKTPEMPSLPVDSPMTPDVLGVPTLPTPPPVPDTDSQFFPTRPSSRGSVRSMQARSKSSMTPEKQRLLKAVEMRKKQLRRVQSGSTQSTVIAPEPVQEEEEIVATVPINRNVRNSSSSQSARKSDSGVDVGFDDQEKRQDSAAGLLNMYDSPDASISDNEKPELVSDEPTKDADVVGTRNADVIIANITQPETRDAAMDANATAKVPAGSEPTIESSKADQHDEACQRNDNSIQNSSRMDGDSVIESPEIQDEPTFRKRSSDQQRRRQGLVLPLTIDTQIPSDGEVSDDDLMDELHNATVQEARPVNVSRSPASPFFTRPGLVTRHSSNSIPSTIHASPKLVAIQRTFSGSGSRKPSINELAPPETPTKPQLTRSLSDSAQSTPHRDSDDTLAVSRKGSVQPGISKRIGELAGSRSKNPSPSPPSARSPLPSPPTNANRFGNKYAPAGLRGRGSPENSPSVKRDQLQPTGMLNWSHNAASKRSQPSTSTSTSTQAIYKVEEKSQNNRDSVSVTARIVRSDQSDGSPQKGKDLYRSPITISHVRAPPAQPNFQPVESALSSNRRESIATDDATSVLSYHQERSLSPAMSRTSQEAGKRKSFSRYQRRMSAVSESQQDAQSQISETSKPGRASRLFKRMSVMGGRKKNTQPLPPNEKPILSSVQDYEKELPGAIVIGDLNVQFPNTGLWKRRWAEIDDVGNLIFTTTKQRFELGTTKRYPLMDFNNIHVPNMDEQELPNSVMLPLRIKPDTALQCSCEDAAAQRQLLQLLKRYHQAWQLA